MKKQYRALVELGRKKFYSKEVFKNKEAAIKESEKQVKKIIALPILKKKELRVKFVTSGYREEYLE